MNNGVSSEDEMYETIKLDTTEGELEAIGNDVQATADEKGATPICCGARPASGEICAVGNSACVAVGDLDGDAYVSW